VPRQSGLPQVHAVTTQRDSLAVQELALTPPLREAAVGSDDSVPGQVLVCGGQDLTDESRRGRVDVAVRADEALGDLTDARQDARGSRSLLGAEGIAGASHRTTAAKTYPPSPAQ
jgi:hypothetical protein